MTSRLTGDEALRKGLHVAAGALAFAVRDLGFGGTVLLASALLLFNLLLLPRFGGERLWRPDERERGGAPGILFYPLAVLGLVLAFPARPEVAAGVWGLLAFGDGAAALVGSALGRRRLPWNQGKTWVGSVAFAVCGAAAVAILVLWTAPGRYSAPFAIVVAVVVSVVAALVESWPIRLDDNASVPFAAAILAACLLSTRGHWQAAWADPDLAWRCGWAIGVNLVLAAVAGAAGSLDRSGAVAGFCVGTAVWIGLGGPGFALLAGFFVLGSGGTRLGYARKIELGVAQPHGGRRSARNAVANGAVAAFAALFAAFGGEPTLYALAFGGALATAAADTVASEIGTLWGGRTLRITDFAPVRPGTEGAVSTVGTLAGTLAAATLALLGGLVGLYPATGAGIVLLAGVAGLTVDSLLGASLERRGLLDNEAVNLLATLAGASSAAALASL